MIRGDDGTGDLAQEFGGTYAAVLSGTSPGISPELRLPPAFRIDVARASDAQIVSAVAQLIAAYVGSLVFAQNDAGAFSGSPFDAFLAKNGLPRKPRAGEGDLAYSRRLRSRLELLDAPIFVTPADGTLRLHDQAFAFGPQELAGLLVFLREPQPGAPPADGTGNCVICHPAPVFTDGSFHNTGASQLEYDAIHGDGAFSALRVPSLAVRRRNPDTFLPPTPEHPDATGRFRDVPSLARPGRTDLGLWNVFANPDFPLPQPRLTALLYPSPRSACDKKRSSTARSRASRRRGCATSRTRGPTSTAVSSTASAPSWRSTRKCRSGSGPASSGTAPRSWRASPFAPRTAPPSRRSWLR